MLALPLQGLCSEGMRFASKSATLTYPGLSFTNSNSDHVFFFLQWIAQHMSTHKATTSKNRRKLYMPEVKTHVNDHPVVCAPPSSLTHAMTVNTRALLDEQRTEPPPKSNNESKHKETGASSGKGSKKVSMPVLHDVRMSMPAVVVKQKKGMFVPPPPSVVLDMCFVVPFYRIR